jgi:hypothetical protein
MRMRAEAEEIGMEFARIRKTHVDQLHDLSSQIMGRLHPVHQCGSRSLIGGVCADEVRGKHALHGKEEVEVVYSRHFVPTASP